MKLSEFYKLAEGFAPKSLSDEYCLKYGAYDNSGVLVDTGEEVKCVLFSLDLSKTAVKKAIESKANLIVTHHPAIYGKIGGISIEDPLGQKLIECIKNGISVISMHLNLDGAKGGIDESLMEAVQLASGRKEGGRCESLMMHSLTGGGYGRVYEIEKTKAQALGEGLKKELSSEKVFVYGSGKTVEKAASFCGAGGDEESVKFALSANADVIVSADFKHHVIAYAIENGLSVIQTTHYASENYGFKKYYEKIREATNVPCVWHEDGELL